MFEGFLGVHARIYQELDFEGKCSIVFCEKKYGNGDSLESTMRMEVCFLEHMYRFQRESDINNE